MYVKHVVSTIVAEESITYPQCVFADLGIQHAVRMRHIVICVLHGSTIFFHIIS